MAVEIKIIDRNRETFTYKNVQSYVFIEGGVLDFVDSEGDHHITNEEFHLIDLKPESKKREPASTNH